MRYAFSDSNGGFTIDGVFAGQHAISAQKPGYFNGHEAGGSFRSAQFVDAGPNSDSVVIKLAAENVIFGRLTDVNGQPVESVGVRLTRRTLRNGVWRMESRSSATSDEDGTYRFPNLQPGSYYVSAGPDVARRDALFSDPEMPRTGWQGIYYPQAPDLASASPIQVTSGQKIEADLVVNRVPVYVVSGMVSGFPPGRGVSLQVQNSAGDFVGASVRFHHDTGEFEIRLPAGSYRLKAYSQVGEQQLRTEVRLTVEKDLTNLQLALQPAVSIPIHARIEDRSQDATQPATSRGFVLARDASDSPPVSVHLVATDPGGTDAYSIPGGTKGNRTLSLHGVEPGRYMADISAYGGWYVASAVCGNTNLLSDDLVVTAGGGSCSIELSLRNDGGTLSAKVNSTAAAAGMALLVPAHGRGAPRSTSFYTPNASTPAQFQISGIAPGEYLVYAFDSPEGVEYSNPEVLQSYSSQAAPVTISPGQTTKVTAQLIQTGSSSE
jgi:Carboxypeptidase regulatory-like domain